MICIYSIASDDMYERDTAEVVQETEIMKNQR